MTGLRHLGVAALLVLADCDRGSSTEPASAQVSASSAPSAASPPPVASNEATVEDAGAPILELGPEPETKPRQERERAVLALLAGQVDVASLPEVATEPGEPLDEHLRDALAPRRVPPKIRTGKITVSGELSEEVVRRIVRQRFGQLRACYEPGLSRNPLLQGRIGVRLVVGTDGEVKQAQTTGSDVPDSGVVECVVRAFGRFQFPKPESGIVQLTIPLLLEPGDVPRR